MLVFSSQADHHQSTDFRRNRRHPGHLLVLHQLRHHPVFAILHRCHQLRACFHVLRCHGHVEYGRGGANGYLGESVAQEVRAKVQGVFEHEGTAAVITSTVQYEYIDLLI